MDYDASRLADLPPEMIQAVLAKMSFRDAKSTCDSSPDLKAMCNEYDLLEGKARHYTEEQAPLSKLISTHTEYAEMIERGFKTTYWFDDRAYGRNVLNNRAHFSSEPREQMTPFSIVGLPPPKGTVVHIVAIQQLVVYGDSSHYDYMCEVFGSTEDIYAQANLSTATSDHLITLITNQEDYLEPGEEYLNPADGEIMPAVDIINELLRSGEINGTFYFKLTLP